MRIFVWTTSPPGTVWIAFSSEVRTQHNPESVQVIDMRPSEQMSDLGVVQYGSPS